MTDIEQSHVMTMSGLVPREQYEDLLRIEQDLGKAVTAVDGLMERVGLEQTVQVKNGIKSAIDMLSQPVLQLTPVKIAKTLETALAKLDEVSGKLQAICDSSPEAKASQEAHIAYWDAMAAMNQATEQK